MKIRLLVLLVSCIATAVCRASDGGYLFVTFRGEATPMTEQIYFMLSDNGHDWKAMNNAEPVLVSALGEKGVRDPYIIRSHDNSRFFLIATDLSINLNPDWGRAVRAGSKSIVIWESADLVNWSEPRLVKVAPDDAGCTWAPEVVYDDETGEYMVFWASLTAGDDFSKQRIWAARTKDFKTFGEPFIYIEKPTTIIDTTIIKDGDTFYRFTKDERDKAITMEKGMSIMGDWKEVDDFSLSKLRGYEGPTSFMREPAEGDKSAKWTLLLDHYAAGEGYKAFDTDDLGSGQFEASGRMNFPFHPVRHGTVLSLTPEEYKRLEDADRNLGFTVGNQSINTFAGAVATSDSDWVKKMNIVIDDDSQTIYLPLKQGAKLSSFDPEFVLKPGVTISPTGRQDFRKGAVDYEVTVNNITKTYTVSAAVNNNPVIEGYFADPEIIYSNKEKKYFLYPTSDGFDGWSGTYFQTFSSPDLIHWRNEGVILDLNKDVSWADRNAWAPTGIERKVNGKYKYYYYFTAAQKIGVAVADNPAGPFVDSGKPLINFRPDGVEGGQEIDPDVFHDPVADKYYLYWGNGYMAVAQLNDDMVSIDPSTVKVMTPDNTFREGAEVFFRKGKYYFLWSEDDTRDPNYRVRYAISDSPTGPLHIPEDNLVIAKNLDLDILATGHNSVINKPGTDEWFIVYHRFNRPKGKSMGGAAGFHREVCIDKLVFNKDGTIIQTIPTLEGLK